MIKTNIVIEKKLFIIIFPIICYSLFFFPLSIVVIFLLKMSRNAGVSIKYYFFPTT
jgi:hypothetical protein